MRKFNFSTGVSTALVAMALVTGLSVPVDAAKVDKALSQSEVTKSGVSVMTAAPTVSVENIADGQVATSWKVTVSDVPANVQDAEVGVPSSKTRVLVFDKGDRTKPLNGSASVNKNGNMAYDGGRVFYYQDPTSSSYSKNEFTISGGSFTPGQKEIVAYTFDGAGYAADYKAARAAYNAAVNTSTVSVSWSDYAPVQSDYWVASAPVEITVSNEAFVSTTVTTTSIQLDMGTASINTGYEIYRKVGKKYQKIATIASDVYTDKGLVSKTTYSYKVRPYYKDSKTGEVVYGKEGYAEATTKGSALKLVTNVNKKDKVQLSWQKVKGAKQYEIYRSDTFSATSEIKKGYSDSYTTYKKIATVKKSKKKYVDKKVQKNRQYSYIVRAVIAKDKKVKGDKDAYIQESGYVDLSFGQISVNTTYTDANGNATVEWKKVYGATSYIVEKNAYDPATKRYNWVQVQVLPKTATKTTLAADVAADVDGTVVSIKTQYRIKAVGAAGNSSEDVTTVTKKNGNVQSVTAKATTNGIQVSWSPVAGAAYYRVYRVRTDALVDNKDIGAYATKYGTQVTEYVGATTPVAVDVAAWNAAVDASVAQEKVDWEAWNSANGKFDYSKYLSESDKLNAKATYHYQNYAYAQNVFTTTSILDYFGDIYSAESGSMSIKTAVKGADGKANATAWDYTFNPVVEDVDVLSGAEDGRPQEGVDYTYYVEAVMATAKTADDYAKDSDQTFGILDEAAYNAAKAAYDAYWAASYEERENMEEPSYPYEEKYTEYVPVNAASIAAPYTTQLVYNTAVTGPKASDAEYLTTPVAKVSSYNYKNEMGTTAGVKKVGSAAVTAVQPIKAKIKIKSVSSSKGKVTLKLKKKVKAADYYKVYRSTKKKGKYTVAGITKNAKTLSFKDAGVTKGKTYYYKVVPVVKNEAGAEVEGKASAVKKVKVK